MKLHQLHRLLGALAPSLEVVENALRGRHGLGDRQPIGHVHGAILLQVYHFRWPLRRMVLIPSDSRVVSPRTLSAAALACSSPELKNITAELARPRRSLAGRARFAAAVAGARASYFWVGRCAGSLAARDLDPLQRVSQTAVCDTPARAPSDERRRVSYPVSDSLSCKRQARGPPRLVGCAHASTGVSR